MKSSHHLLHDQASKGHGSTPGLTSQIDLHWFAISSTAIAHFYLPTAIIFCASWYHGHLKHFSQTAEKRRTSNFFVSLPRLGSSSAVWLFMVYGILVVDGILYFNENYEITLPNHLCRITCLDEDVFLLLSIFPVYMGHFIKKREEKSQQHLEIWKESNGIACSSEWLEMQMNSKARRWTVSFFMLSKILN